MGRRYIALSSRPNTLWLGARSNAFWSIFMGSIAGFFFGYIVMSTRPFVSVDRIQTIEKPTQGCEPPVIVQTLKNDSGGSAKAKLGLKVIEAIADLQKEKRRLLSSLVNETRLMCWVMTEPKNNEKRDAIMETWGKRCHLLLFMVGAKEMLVIDQQTETADPNTNSGHTISAKSRRRISSNAFIVYLDMDNDTYDNLWSKTRNAFVYIHEHFRNDYDWILKVDDDSFVIIENLRLFLRDKKLEDPFYYGCQYSAASPRGYASGGPGYIMSRLTVNKFAAQLERKNASNDDECLTKAKAGNGPEDSRVAQCLDKLGIGPGDTRDTHGRFRFSPFTPEHTINHHTLPSKYNWFWGFSAHKMADGFECCSDTAISFHYITPSMMRVMEYLIYYVHPFSSRELWNYNISDTSRAV